MPDNVLPQSMGMSDKTPWAVRIASVDIVIVPEVKPADCAGLSLMLPEGVFNCGPRCLWDIQIGIAESL